MGIPFDPNDTGVGGANAAVAITFAALADRTHIIWQIDWSYSGAPTGGALTITDGGTTVFQVDISAAGPDSIIFAPPKKAKLNSAVVVTLAAGGAGVVGKLNVAQTTGV
jgi:hypothetical protein